MVICLERGADLHMAQLMSLPLTISCFSKIQIGFLFWYRLTRVVPEKGPLNGCVCVSSFAILRPIFPACVVCNAVVRVVVYISVFCLQPWTKRFRRSTTDISPADVSMLTCTIRRCSTVVTYQADSQATDLTVVPLQNVIGSVGTVSSCAYSTDQTFLYNSACLLLLVSEG